MKIALNLINLKTDLNSPFVLLDPASIDLPFPRVIAAAVVRQRTIDKDDSASTCAKASWNLA